MKYLLTVWTDNGKHSKHIVELPTGSQSEQYEFITHQVDESCTMWCYDGVFIMMDKITCFVWRKEN